ncbi:MAG: hypothetical protein WB622_11575 [Acidobacteriaceae bacterium]
MNGMDVAVENTAADRRFYSEDVKLRRPRLLNLLQMYAAHAECRGETLRTSEVSAILGFLSGYRVFNADTMPRWSLLADSPSPSTWPLCRLTRRPASGGVPWYGGFEKRASEETACDCSL